MSHTASGGLHVYFDAGERELKCSAGLLGPGLDVRGDGGYVILPSPGSGYRWDPQWNFKTVALASAPDWLWPPKPSRAALPPPPKPTEGLSRYGEAAIEGACNAIVRAPPGEQERCLNAECFSIGTAAGAGLVPTESLMNNWIHIMEENVYYEEAISREYWAPQMEKIRPGDRIEVHSYDRPGDRIEVHSYDRRLIFFLQVLEVNTATEPVYFEFAALPIYPPDLRLPEVLPQRAPRYAVRMAPGGGGAFNCIDASSGKPVNSNPMDRQRAMELASSLERGLATGAEQLAAEFARHQATVTPVTSGARRTAKWREKQRAEAATAEGDAA
jgi:hypothetical protein